MPPDERAQIFIHLATVHTELGQTQCSAYSLYCTLNFLIAFLHTQIFIHLATVHTELGQTHEATKIIQDAKVHSREFAPPEYYISSVIP